MSVPEILGRGNSMSQEVNVGQVAASKKRLKVAGQNLDIDAELAKFEAEERQRLGLALLASFKHAGGQRVELLLPIGDLHGVHVELLGDLLDGFDPFKGF
jgi:hypothetical protein